MSRQTSEIRARLVGLEFILKDCKSVRNQSVNLRPVVSRQHLQLVFSLSSGAQLKSTSVSVLENPRPRWSDASVMLYFASSILVRTRIVEIILQFYSLSDSSLAITFATFL